MTSKFMPHTPANTVASAKMPAQAASRFDVSASSIVTIDRFTWIAVPMVSRRPSRAALMRARWSTTSRK